MHCCYSRWPCPDGWDHDWMMYILSSNNQPWALNIFPLFVFWGSQWKLWSIPQAAIPRPQPLTLDQGSLAVVAPRQVKVWTKMASKPSMFCWETSPRHFLGPKPIESSCSFRSRRWVSLMTLRGNKKKSSMFAGIDEMSTQLQSFNQQKNTKNFCQLSRIQQGESFPMAWSLALTSSSNLRLGHMNVCGDVYESSWTPWQLSLWTAGMIRVQSLHCGFNLSASKSLPWELYQGIWSPSIGHQVNATSRRLCVLLLLHVQDPQ